MDIKKNLVKFIKVHGEVVHLLYAVKVAISGSKSLCCCYCYWWGENETTWYCGHYWPIVPAPVDNDGDCGATGGMKIGRRNGCTWGKPAPVPLCSPQIPHDLACAQTQAVAIFNQNFVCIISFLPCKLNFQPCCFNLSNNIRIWI
jgi:hypothetical protein